MIESRHDGAVLSMDDASIENLYHPPLAPLFSAEPVRSRMRWRVIPAAFAIAVGVLAILGFAIALVQRVMLAGGLVEVLQTSDGIGVLAFGGAGILWISGGVACWVKRFGSAILLFGLGCGAMFVSVLLI